MRVFKNIFANLMTVVCSFWLKLEAIEL